MREKKENPKIKQIENNMFIWKKTSWIGRNGLTEKLEVSSKRYWEINR